MYHYKTDKLSYNHSIVQCFQHSTTPGPKCTDRRKYFVEINQIIVIIDLKSSSGKIPAGNITIDLNSLKKGANKIETNILKCPDKSALISFSVTF